MAWDSTKVDGTDSLPASEWNTHVTDQKAHNSRHIYNGSDEVHYQGNQSVPNLTVPYQAVLDANPFIQIDNSYSGGTAGHNIFQICAIARASSLNNVVAIFGESIANGTNSRVWGSNVVGYANSSTGIAIGQEVDYGVLVSGGAAYGLVVASAGNFAPNSAIQINVNNANSIPQNGINFNIDSGWQPVHSLTWQKTGASFYLDYDPSTQIASFKNNANTAVFSIDSLGNITVATWNGANIPYSKLTLTSSIVNTDISASAAIAYSKLALTGNIVNADISGTAAIAYAKLALGSSIVNTDISASAAIAYSKLALTGNILNADISASAAIAYSKLALTGNILNADISASAAIAYSKLALTGNIVNADVSTNAAIDSSKLLQPTNHDVTASRAAGTVYRNTTGKVMTVYASIHSTVNAFTYTVNCDTNTPPTLQIIASVFNGTAGQNYCVTFNVPNNYYYKVSADAGTPAVGIWIEQY